jgi:hypothetical protein
MADAPKNQDPQKKPEEQKAPGPFLVRAVAVGYFGGSLRAYGDKFEIPNDEAFGVWMEAVNEVDVKRLAARVAKEAAFRKRPAGPDVNPTGVIKVPIKR